MKRSRSFLSKLTLVAAAVSATLAAPEAHAGVMHSDATLITYTDFGQNRGRYVVGAKVNALLESIRQADGGIKIIYTDGTTPYVIPLAQGMIDFNATDDIGAQVAVSPTFAATVLHNGPISASYGNRTVGGTHAINYEAIDIRYSDTFRLSPNGYDYMLQRQSKVQTDVTWNPVTTVTDMSTLPGDHMYHSGAGSMGMYVGGQYKSLGGAYQYIIGAINKITSANTHKGTTNISVCENPNYGNGIGASLDNPLPNAIRGGDSGSPIFIYNEASGQYEYIAAQQSGSTTFGQARGNVEWTHATLASFNVNVDMSAEGVTNNTIYLNAIATQGETKTDNKGNSGTIWSGKVTTDAAGELALQRTDAEGNTADVTYKGIKNGLNTWATLSDVKDNSNWYAYSGHLLQKDEDLFFNENLVFSSAAEENHIVLNATVDLGVGYVEFSKGEGFSGEGNAKYTITSATNDAGSGYLLNSAGYVVNEGAEVHIKLTNPDTYMYEWRKTGAGDLYIDGTGNTNALVTVGGSGTTYLQQTDGYAAYNVLASSGATVQLAANAGENEGIKQIARDFTFGSGGGVLDMNGNSMDWRMTHDVGENGTTSDSIAEDGFTINALTEEAVILNTAGSSVLTFKESGEQTFLGSFQDSDNGSLRIDYQGEGTWSLHSIHTQLTHTDSGLTVTNGKVILSGTNTVHGMGSLNGRGTNRYTSDRDWHYADARMNVEVTSGGTFELGSHARLIGNVTVASGGTYIMREGVKLLWEYVEGGQALEETSKYAEFYGHKGDISLESGAKLEIAYNNGVNSATSYAGDITGAGDVSIALGTSGAQLTLSGDNDFSGENTLSSGTLVGSDLHALGVASTDDTTKWLVESAAVLAVGDAVGLLPHIKGESTGVLALMQDMESQLNLADNKGLIIGALAGCTVHYGNGSNEFSTWTTYDHDNDSATAERNAWVLGGGGGELVVHFKLTGDNDLILGNEYGKGKVTLANLENDFSGNIIFKGQVTLDYVVGENGSTALGGNASLNLSYGNRAYGHRGTSNFSAASAGTLLMDRISGTSIDLSGHENLHLGSSTEDATLSGITTNSDYKFGGSTGKLTVDVSLGDVMAEGGTTIATVRNLIVDGQTYSGGEIHLAQAATLTGTVTVMGYDKSKTDLTEGDITLSFGVEDALANAASVIVKDGGSIDLAGNNQYFKSLTLGSTGTVFDSSVNDSGATLSLGAGDVSGTLVLSHLEKTGEGALSLGGSSAITNVVLSGGSLTVSGAANIGVLDVVGGTLSVSGGTTGSVIVRSGAAYIFSGDADGFGERVRSVVLDGGSLSNNGNDCDTSLRQIYRLSLTKDSSIEGSAEFGMVGSAHAATSIDLAGHTLTKSGGFTFDIVNTSITAGTIDVKAGVLAFNDKGKGHDSTIAASILQDGGKFTINKYGSGTLTLSGKTTEVDQMWVSAGTTHFSGENTSITGALDITAGTLRFSGKTVTFSEALEIRKNGSVVIEAETFETPRILVYNSDKTDTDSSSPCSDLYVYSGTVNVTSEDKSSGNASGIILGHYSGGEGRLLQIGGVINAKDTWTVVSWDSSAGLYIHGGTYNAYGIALGGASGNTRGHNATLVLAGGRLNIGEGGITNYAGGTNKTIDLSGGTLGTLTATGWTSSQAMSISNTVTFDTQVANEEAAGSITLNGTISGNGKLVKTGAGTLTLAGTVSLNDITVEKGILDASSGTQTIVGNVGIAQGAMLHLGSELTLGTGQMLSVLASEESDSALLGGTLVLNGGSLTFDGATLSHEAVVLTLGGIRTGDDFSEATSLHFINTQSLGAGTYLLAETGTVTSTLSLESAGEGETLSGTWNNIAFTAGTTDSDYLNITGISTSESGALAVSFSVADGYAIWDGTAEASTWTTTRFGSGDAEESTADLNLVFNDSAESKAVDVTEAVNASGMIFSNTAGEANAYTLSGAAIATGSLVVKGGGEVTLNSVLTVSNLVTETSEADDGTVTETTSELGTTQVANGILTIGGARSSLATTDVATNGILNITGSGVTASTLTLADGATLRGSADGSLSVEAMSIGTNSTFDGVQLAVAPGTSNLTNRAISENTIRLLNGAVVDDRNTCYRVTGTLNLVADGSTSESMLYVRKLRLSDNGNTQSYLNVDKHVHLVITGTASGQDGAFALSHWGSTLRAEGKLNQLSIDGRLSSAAVLSAWDTGAVINVNDGGELNLLAGLARAGNAWGGITLNVNAGAVLNATGGTHNNALTVNLKNGSTLGAIANSNRAASFSNNMILGSSEGAGTVTINTNLFTKSGYSLTEGTGGTLTLSGAISTAIPSSADGELAAFSETQLKLVGSGTLVVANSLELGALVSDTDNTAVTLNAGALSFSGSGTTVFAGTVSADSFTKLGEGEHTFSGDASLGNLNLQLGELTFSGNAVLGGESAALSVMAGTMLKLSGSALVKNAIANSGRVELSSEVVFDIGNLTPSDSNVYTLISGDGTVSVETLGRENFLQDGCSIRRGEVAYSENTVTFTAGAAADLVWNGTSDTHWNTSNQNWFNNGNADTFYSCDNVTFNAGDGVATDVTIAQSLVAGSITVAGDYNFAFSEGCTLTFNSLSIAENASLTVNGTLSGGPVSGAGKLDLGTTGTFTGTLADTWSGTVKLSDRSDVRDFNFNAYGNANSTVEVSGISGWFNGAEVKTKLDLTDTEDGASAIQVTNGTSRGTYTYSGAISGDGTFEHAWSGGDGGITYSFKGDVSEWTGAFKHNASGKTNNLKFTDSATEIGMDITNSAGTLNVTFENDADSSFSGVLSGASTLTKKGAGTLTISGANTYSGTTTISGGTVVWTGTRNSTSGNITIASGATLDVSRETGKLYSTSYSGGTVTIQGTLKVYDYAYGGSLGSLKTNGAGANGTYDIVVIDGGNLVFTNTTAEHSRATVVSGNGGKVTLEEDVDISLTGNAYGNAFHTRGGTLELEVKKDASLSLSGTNGIISGSGSVCKTGEGTLTFSGANTYTGETTILAGLLEITNKEALGSRSVTIGDGSANNSAVLDLATDMNGKAPVYTLAGGTLRATVVSNGEQAQVARDRAAILLTANSTIDAQANFGMISQGWGPNTLDLGGHVLTKVGNEAFFLSNTTITAGTINIEAGAIETYKASYGSKADFQLSGGILRLQNTAFTVKSLSGTAGEVSLGSGTLTIAGTSEGATNYAYAGTITGTGSLIKNGNETFELSGANTYSGGTTINGGTLKVSGKGALGSNNSNIRINDGGTLELAVNMDNTYNKFYTYTLNGGTLRATTETGFGSRQMATTEGPEIELTADSTIDAKANFGMILSGWGANQLNLNNHVLTKAGAGEFYLSQTTVSAGTINIKDGSIKLITNGGVSDGSAADFQLNGGTLNLNNSSFTVKSLSGTAGTLARGTGTLTTATVDVSPGGNLKFTGTGTTTLTGATQNASGGTIELQGGTLAFKGSEAMTVSGNLKINGSSGTTTTLKQAANGQSVEIANLNIAEGNTLQIADNTANSFTNMTLGNLSGSGVLHWVQKNYGGTTPSVLKLTGTSSFTGEIKAERADRYTGRPYCAFLEIASDSAASGATINLIDRDANYGRMTLAVNTSNASIAGLKGETHTTVISGVSSDNVTSAISSANNTLTITGSGNYTYAGTIAGGTDSEGNNYALSLVKTGSGTQTFSGTSTFKDITVSAGNLTFTNAALSTTTFLEGSTMVVSGGSVVFGTNNESMTNASFGENLSLEISGSGEVSLRLAKDYVKEFKGNIALKNGATLQKWDGGLKITGNVSLGDSEASATSITSYWQKQSIEIAGMLSGLGTTYIDYSNGNESGKTEIFSISGSENTYSGTLVIGEKSGDGDKVELRLNNAKAATNATINLAGGSKASMTVVDGVSIAGLDGTSGSTVTTSTTDTATFTVNGGGTFAGTITGSLNLVKEGSTTLVLSGVNTYTGETQIVEGTVELSGSGTLGDVAGAVTIAGGSGHLTIGDGVTVSNAVTILVGESNIESAIISGSGTLSLGTDGKITIEKVENQQALSLAASVYQYQIVDANSTMDNSWTRDSFTLDGWGEGWFVQNYENGLLTLAIPEPTTFGFLSGLAALVFVGGRRRKRMAR